MSTATATDIPRLKARYNDEIKAGLESGVPPFFMSTTEVPYAVWHDVYRWATSNMYASSAQ